MKNRVIKHLKSDIKTFKKEASDDRSLIKALKSKKHEKKESKKHEKNEKKKHKASSKKNKVKVVMQEFKSGKLHSGSKKGPKVTNRRQAIAIGLSEQRKENKK